MLAYLCLLNHTALCAQLKSQQDWRNQHSQSTHSLTLDVVGADSWLSSLPGLAGRGWLAASHCHPASAPDHSPIPYLLVPGNLSQSWRQDRLITSLLFSAQQDAGSHTTLAQGEKGDVSPRHRDRDDFPSIGADCITHEVPAIFNKMDNYKVMYLWPKKRHWATALLLNFTKTMPV